MILIVGLGNPTEKYAQTRHNFGFMVLDALAATHKVSFREAKKFRTEVAELEGFGTKVMLVKPQTYMNLSGEAVGALAHFYKVEPKRIWVVADDLDLPLGKIRVRHGGEAGGHHGLESIRDHLKSNDYVRIRMGIRGPELRELHAQRGVATNDFVLTEFNPRERQLAENAIQLAAGIIDQGLQEEALKAHTHEVDGYDEAAA